MDERPNQEGEKKLNKINCLFGFAKSCWTCMCM